MTSSPYRSALPVPKVATPAPAAPWLRLAIAFAPRWLGGRALGDRLKARAFRLCELGRLVDAKHRFAMVLDRAEEARLALLRDPASASLFREASLRRDVAVRHRTNAEQHAKALDMARALERELRETDASFRQFDGSPSTHKVSA